MKFSTFIYWFLIGIALIQFIPVDRTQKPVNPKENFVEVFNTPADISKMLKNACYDCHSNEVKYPDYAFVAPVSWAVENHVDRGRKHLNFSEWGSFNPDLKKNMLENTVADLRQNRMPLAGYMVYHPEARLSPSQREQLARYFEEILKSGKY